MILGTACLGTRSLDGAAIREALAGLGLERVLLVPVQGAVPAGLRGVPVAGVRVTQDGQAAGLAAARAAGCGRLVLELDPERSLERACRELFDLSRGQAGLTLSVATPAAGPCADPAALELLLDDLAARGVTYWHRPAAARLAGAGDTDWLDRVGRYLAGVSLDDVAGGERGLLPGLGELDFAGLARSLVRGTDVALDVDPVPDLGLLRFTLEQLRRAGFA